VRTPFAHLSKRALAAEALRLGGIGKLLRGLAPWRGVLVLSYHRIGVAGSFDTARSLVTATAETLDRQLRFLTRECELLEPAELDAIRRDPELLSRRGRRVLVTFDDGYRDLYEAAHPVLQANGVHAAMFLCSGFIDGVASAWWDEVAWIIRHSSLRTLPEGPWSEHALALDGDANVEHAIDVATRRCWERSPGLISALLQQLGAVTGSGRRPAADSTRDWITWDMARELSAAGHRIGAHTLNHPILAQLPQERQREEISGSADRIEAELGERPRWFAYPVGVPGVFDEHSRAAAAEAGIELAFSNYGGYVLRESFHPLDVSRISVETLRTPALFAATLTLPAVFARAN
jgi:peptidoglycan/xylan/chitin deacetylase (PgdA/CDA1 family)